MEFREGEQLKNIKEEQEEIRKRVEEQVDPNFSSGRKLYRDVLNFWGLAAEMSFLKILSPEQIKKYLSSLQPVLHYKEGYLEKGDNDAEYLRQSSGNESAEYHIKYYKAELDRIMELSDSEQIEKYDRLVDEYNTELKRIKEENDVKSLLGYFEKVKALVDEKNKNLQA